MNKLAYVASVVVVMLSISVTCEANEMINKCKKEKNCDFIVFGTGTSDPRMSFIVFEKVFNKFTDKDKKDLKEILKQKIKEANRNPNKYVDIPASAPAYGMFLNNIKNMKSYSVILSEKKDRKGLFVDKETMINY